MSLAPAFDLRPEEIELFNIEAEQALLGCVLFDNSAIQLCDGLAPAMFYEPLHSRMWAAIVERAAHGRVDMIWMFDRLKSDPSMLELGGLRYLADLVDHAPPTANAPDWASIIHDSSMRRSLVDVCAKAMATAGNTASSAFELIASLEREITTLATGAAPADSNLVDGRTSALETMEQIGDEHAQGKPKGRMTGLRCVDFRLGGLKPGKLIIIGARPSAGKTALLRNVMFGAAMRNRNDAFALFCLEMSRRELDERTLSALTYRDEGWSSIHYQNMSGDKLTPLEVRRLRELAYDVPANFILDDTTGLSVDYIERRVWALKRKGPLGAVGIDYLQIMDRPKAVGRNQSDVLAEMTGRLKRLARRAEVAIVLLSQISRGVEARDDKRPQLADLRESGAIEQDADAVLMLYREFYYLERSKPKEGTPAFTQWEIDCEDCKHRLDVICAKNRGGGIGSDEQEYIAEFDVISDPRRG